MNNPVVYWDPDGESVYNSEGKQIDPKGGASENFYRDPSGKDHALPSKAAINATLNIIDHAKRDNNGYEKTARVLTNGDAHYNENNLTPVAQTDNSGDRTVNAHGEFAKGFRPPPGVTDEVLIHDHPVNTYIASDGKEVTAGSHDTNMSQDDKKNSFDYTNSEGRTVEGAKQIIAGNISDDEVGASFYDKGKTEADFSLSESALQNISMGINNEEITEKIKAELENEN